MRRKRIIIKPFEYKGVVPEYKSRSARELEEILHKHKVIAYKRRLEDEISHPIQPFSLPQYQTPERRMDLGKAFIYHLRALMP